MFPVGNILTTTDATPNGKHSYYDVGHPGPLVELLKPWMPTIFTKIYIVVVVIFGSVRKVVLLWIEFSYGSSSLLQK